MKEFIKNFKWDNFLRIVFTIIVWVGLYSVYQDNYIFSDETLMGIGMSILLTIYIWDKN